MGKSHNRRDLRGGTGRHVEEYDDDDTGTEIGNNEAWGVDAAATAAGIEEEQEQPRPRARETRRVTQKTTTVDDTLTDIPAVESVFVNPVKARAEERISTIAWFIVLAVTLLPLVIGAVTNSNTVLYAGLVSLVLTLSAGNIFHRAIVKTISVGLRLRLWLTCAITLAGIIGLIAAEVGTPVWGIMVTFGLGYSLLKHMVNDVDSGTYTVVQVKEEIVEENIK